MPHINLLPWREELRAAKQRQFNTALGGAAVVTGLAIVFVHIQMTSMISSQNQRNQFLDTTIKKVEKQIEEIKTLKKDKERLLARMEVIQKLQSSRPEIVHLFEEIANATPKGVFLLDTARTGDKLDITGVADSNDNVSAFMRKLDASAWLTNPKLSIIDSTNKNWPNRSWFKLEVTQITPKA
ncbi:MAG: PilN domain-containing protein [Gammaproteobacteria bacterium]|jgi:type IV pilus assembly protein PilN